MTRDTSRSSTNNEDRDLVQAASMLSLHASLLRSNPTVVVHLHFGSIDDSRIVFYLTLLATGLFVLYLFSYWSIYSEDFTFVSLIELANMSFSIEHIVLYIVVLIGLLLFNGLSWMYYEMVEKPRGNNGEGQERIVYKMRDRNVMDIEQECEVRPNAIILFPDGQVSIGTCEKGRQNVEDMV